MHVGEFTRAEAVVKVVVDGGEGLQGRGGGRSGGAVPVAREGTLLLREVAERDHEREARVDSILGLDGIRPREPAPAGQAREHSPGPGVAHPLQYSAPDLVATHVQPVLRACDSLLASVNEFSTLSPPTAFVLTPPVFNDGRSQLLLSLSGVIPISITTRGHHNTYNCPLAIWLPLNYPSEPPVVLILPRGNMVLKGTKTRNEQSRLEVDRDGKVLCPYLTEWGRKGEVLPLFLIAIEADV